MDLGNSKHIYRFEPNPFIPNLGLLMNSLTRLGSYLKTDEYKEIYQEYFLNFDDNDQTNDNSKKTIKKNKQLPAKK